MQGGLKLEQGWAEPPGPPHFNHCDSLSGRAGGSKSDSKFGAFYCYRTLPMEEQCDIFCFISVLRHCWLGDTRQEGHPASLKTGCRFVASDDVTEALHV